MRDKLNINGTADKLDAVYYTRRHFTPKHSFRIPDSNQDILIRFGTISKTETSYIMIIIILCNIPMISTITKLATISRHKKEDIFKTHNKLVQTSKITVVADFPVKSL